MLLLSDTTLYHSIMKKVLVHQLNIFHNISEPWNTTTMNSSIILTGVKRGNTYVINESAVNILGESLPKDINGINNN